MPEHADAHNQPEDDQFSRLFGDWAEAQVELSADLPYDEDWRHHFNWTLEEAGIDATSLSREGRQALEFVSTHNRIIIEGVRDLVAVTRQVAYEEGFRNGELAVQEDDSYDYGDDYYYLPVVEDDATQPPNPS